MLGEGRSSLLVLAFGASIASLFLVEMVFVADNIVCGQIAVSTGTHHRFHIVGIGVSALGTEHVVLVYADELLDRATFLVLVVFYLQLNLLLVRELDGA